MNKQEMIDEAQALVRMFREASPETQAALNRATLFFEAEQKETQQLLEGACVILGQYLNQTPEQVKQRLIETNDRVNATMELLGVPVDSKETDPALS